MADFVADRRACHTNSAAELATPVTKLDLLSTHLQNHGKTEWQRQSENVLSKKQEALKKCSQSVIFRQPERLYDGYMQRLDQLQLRLTQSLRTRISDNKQIVQSRTHRLVQLSPVTKIQRYQDRLGQLDKLLRSQMALVYDAKVAEVKRLSEALLMLDTSRIVARGYAIVKKEESVVDSGFEKFKDEQTK